MTALRLTAVSELTARCYWTVHFLIVVNISYVIYFLCFAFDSVSVSSCHSDSVLFHFLSVSDTVFVSVVAVS